MELVIGGMVVDTLSRWIENFAGWCRLDGCFGCKRAAWYQAGKVGTNELSSGVQVFNGLER